MNESLSLKIVRLNSSSNGKDKIYRSIQYGCKMLWFILWKTKSNKEYIEILKKLEATMSTTRKVLRFGKSHDMIEGARRNIHIEDDFLRYMLTAQNLNQACYLILDNALLLESFGFFKMKNSPKINEWCTKFWLSTSIFALARDLYDIINQIETNRSRLKEQNNNSKNKIGKNSNRLRCVLKHLRLLFISNPNLMLDTTKNAFDIFLPLSFLKYVDLSPGAQGAVGLISSLLTLVTIWDSRFKLTP